MQVRYPGLLDFVKTGMIRGKELRELYDDAVKSFGYKGNFRMFQKYTSKVKTRHISTSTPHSRDLNKTEDFINFLKKKKVIDGNDACDMLSCSPDKLFEFIDFLRNQGHEIICSGSRIYLSSDIPSDGKTFHKPLEDTAIIFGVISDTHFGSRHCQITYINEFCEIAKQRGVKYMFVPGDICAGYKVYKGQEFEQYAIGAEEQEDSVLVNLPTGFEWYALGGNHDFSFIKTAGHNPLLTIATLRDDFHYVGYDDADVPILKGVDLKMWHPSGGVPYSYSYRLQKGVEQITYSELAKVSKDVKAKPSVRFLLCGHLHIQMQAMFGSILGLQCGTFEGQTSYLKRKGLHPQIGGYIVEATLDGNGMLREFDTKFYSFPYEIEDDWKSYEHSFDRGDSITDPIFG